MRSWRATRPPGSSCTRSSQGLSPLALLSTLAVLSSGCGRLNGTVLCDCLSPVAVRRPAAGAGATIAVGSLLPAEELALGVLFVVLAGLLVWLPVALYLVAGSRADGLNERARSWLVSNERAVTAASMLVLGAALAVDSAVRLL